MDVRAWRVPAGDGLVEVTGGQPWTDTFVERVRELRADISDGDVTFRTRDMGGIALRSCSGDHDRFAHATLRSSDGATAAVEDVSAACGISRPVDGDLLRSMLGWCEVDFGASLGSAVNQMRGTLRSFDEAVKACGAGPARALARLRLRRYSVVGASGIRSDQQSVHIHVNATAFHGDAFGTSGLALDELSQLTALAGHELGTKVAEQAVRLAGAVAPQSRECGVVFGPGPASALVHEVVGHGLEADAVLGGSAIWRRRLELAGPEALSISEEGAEGGSWEAVSVDEEGSPVGRTLLVERGRVAHAVTDRVTSMRMGAQASTGHGRRGSFMNRPMPRVRHTVVAAGRDDPTSIIRDTATGIFVEAVESGEANVRDGSFAVRVLEGREICAGRLGRTVAGFTITGDLEDFFHLDAVADDSSRSHAVCGRGSLWLPISGMTPTVRLPRVTVHGG